MLFKAFNTSNPLFIPLTQLKNYKLFIINVFIVLLQYGYCLSSYYICITKYYYFENKLLKLNFINIRISKIL